MYCKCCPRLGLVAAILAAAVLTACATTGGPATAADLRQSVSGAFIPSSFDTNLDGNNGVSYLASATGTFGRSRYEGLLEAVVLPEPETCEPGEVERRIIVFSIVQRFENGDLLFSSLAPNGGVSCAAPDQRVPFEVTVDITGGTGRFEGAGGRYTFTASSVLLLRDPDGVNVLHAARFGEIRGTIDLP